MWFARSEQGFLGPILRIARRENGRLSFVTNLTLEAIEEGFLPPISADILRGDDAMAFMQAVMDAAYEAGLRPSRAQDERHMKAHLDDMRRFAFHIIKEKP